MNDCNQQRFLFLPESQIGSKKGYIDFCKQKARDANKFGDVDLTKIADYSLFHDEKVALSY